MTHKTRPGQEPRRRSRPPSDANGQVRYETYLQLDKLLSAQQPLSKTPEHDELLFIIQHQVAELWFKLILHELDAAMECLRNDQLPRSIKILNRVKQVQHQLINQWSVLATLTPTEYSAFRDVLGSASGFQSPQYRLLEFKLGNKDRALLSRFSHHLEYYRQLKYALEHPSLYDEFLRYLYRVGHRVPAERVERDWTRAVSASSRRRRGAADRLSASGSVLGRVRSIGAARRHRDQLPVVALPSHEDGGAHHRREDGQRRDDGREVLAEGARHHVLSGAHRGPLEIG